MGMEDAWAQIVLHRSHDAGSEGMKNTYISQHWIETLGSKIYGKKQGRSKTECPCPPAVMGTRLSN